MAATQVQIFISSTFAGLSAEREHLARTLPVALQRRLAPRAIDVSLIDLRWGITEEQLRESGVVRTCFSAVERSAPYFVGLLGNQYGTVPILQPEDIEAYPWLAGLDGRSITELEILHGAINSQNANAIFVDATTSDEIADPRVLRLRSVVASSGAPILRRASDRDEILAFVVQHLAAALEQQLPTSEDPLAPFLAHHGRPLAGRKELSKSATSLVAAEQVLWIHGPSGSGKSAILAQAIRPRSTPIAAAIFPDHVDIGVFQDVLGLTWKALVPGDQLAAVRSMDVREFRARLDKLATSATNITLVWDNAPIEWFKLFSDDLLALPRNVRSIITARHPPPRNARVRALPIPLPSSDEIGSFLTERLATVGRNLPIGVQAKLFSAPSMHDYHFASIVLDELVFGSSHDRLAQDADRLGGSPSLARLIEEMIQRLDNHFGDELGTKALETAFFYEEPLPDKILQGLLKLNDLNYESLRLALSGAFAEHPAGLTLRSSYRRALASSSALENDATARHRLAERLVELSPSRPCDAMHQYYRAGDAERLVSLFEQTAAALRTLDADAVRVAPWLRWASGQGVRVGDTFSRLLESHSECDEVDLSHLMILAALSDLVLPGSNIARDFHALVRQIGGPRTEAAGVHRLASNALARGEWSTASGLAIDALIAAIKTGQNDTIVGVLSTLGAAMISGGAPRIAECWLDGAMEVLGQLNHRDAATEAALQSNLGQVYKMTGRIDRAVVAAQRAVDLRRRNGLYDRLPLGLANLGSVQMAAGLPEEAFANLSEAWELATKLNSPNRGNIAAMLLSAQAHRKKRINSLFNSLAPPLERDASVRLGDAVDFYLSAAEHFAEQGEHKMARRALERAEARASGEGDAALCREIDRRGRYLTDRRNRTWTGRLRERPRLPTRQEESERLWSLFDTKEYARFFLRGSLQAVASDSGDAIIVISKSIDDLHGSPIDGIDWNALKRGVGPPPSQREYIVVYSVSGRFLAFWMPVIPINPVFVAAFNAVIAATAPALDDDIIGAVHTAGDEWTEVVRRLIAARRDYEKSQPDEVRTDSHKPYDTDVCTYFPRLTKFDITERMARDGLVFSWLSNIESAQSMHYPSILWIEAGATPPIMYSDSGKGLGVPVLAVALEMSAGTDRFEAPFLGVFTPDGHRTLGQETVERFRSRSLEVALEILEPAGSESFGQE